MAGRCQVGPNGRKLVGVSGRAIVQNEDSYCCCEGGCWELEACDGSETIYTSRDLADDEGKVLLVGNTCYRVVKFHEECPETPVFIPTPTVVEDCDDPACVADYCNECENTESTMIVAGWTEDGNLEPCMNANGEYFLGDMEMSDGFCRWYYYPTVPSNAEVVIFYEKATGKFFAHASGDALDGPFAPGPGFDMEHAPDIECVNGNLVGSHVFAGLQNPNNQCVGSAPSLILVPPP